MLAISGPVSRKMRKGLKVDTGPLKKRRAGGVFVARSPRPSVISKRDTLEEKPSSPCDARQAANSLPGDAPECTRHEVGEGC
jgi:hypothetical protein